LTYSTIGRKRISENYTLHLQNFGIVAFRVLSTKIEFWNSSIPGIKHEDELMKEGMIFQFGVPPNRIDLINKIEKVNFKSAWDNRKKVPLIYKREKIKIYYIGINELIENKKAVSRFKDKDDLKFLKSVKSKVN